MNRTCGKHCSVPALYPIFLPFSLLSFPALCLPPSLPSPFLPPFLPSMMDPGLFRVESVPLKTTVSIFLLAARGGHVRYRWESLGGI